MKKRTAPELDQLVYRTSSYSGANGQCVEVAATAHGGRFVRDSKDTNTPPHYYSPDTWRAFLQFVKRLD